MTRCLAFLVQSWLWLVVLPILAEKPYIRSTGNCDYAKDLKLNLVCHSSVTDNLACRWRDSLAPKYTKYSVWQTPPNQPGLYVILVSFHSDSELSIANAISIDPQKYMIKGKKSTETEFEYVPFTHTEMHCFKYSLRYFNDLRATCTNKTFKLDEKAIRYGILHYAKSIESIIAERLGTRRSNSVKYTTNLIGILPELLIVSFRDMYKFVS